MEEERQLSLESLQRQKILLERLRKTEKQLFFFKIMALVGFGFISFTSIMFLKQVISPTQNIILLSSGVILLVFIISRHKTRFMKFSGTMILIGGLMNFLVILVNGLQMPIVTLNHLGFTIPQTHNVMTQGNLLFLGDWINVGIMIMSPGDVVALIGGFLMIGYLISILFKHWYSVKKRVL